MSVVITTLTGVEQKLGEDWTLYKFTGEVDGQKKVFQTFDDDLAALIKDSHMRVPVTLEFHVESRSYNDRRGQERTATNNIIDGIAGEGVSDASQSSSGTNGGAGSVNAVVRLRLSAFNTALRTIELGLVSLDDTPSLGDVTQLADAILAYAEDRLADDSDPEDAVPPTADAVTN